MKELSLNILDITENSVKAGAGLIEITLLENEKILEVDIADNGCGMSEDMVKRVSDPFCTTRTTRKMGMGIPFYKLAAEQTGGYIDIVSKEKEKYSIEHGTKVTAVFHKDSIDYTPLGDMISTLTTLIQGSPDIDFVYIHRYLEKEAALDTRQLREILGDVPLGSYDVIVWIKEFLSEQYSELYKR